MFERTLDAESDAALVAMAQGADRLYPLKGVCSWLRRVLVSAARVSAFQRRRCTTGFGRHWRSLSPGPSGGQYGSPRISPAAYSDEKVANRDVWDFGWEIAHAAVSRRPPISLDTIVARAEGYTYDVGFGICLSFKDPVSARAEPYSSDFATFTSP
jgi:hypothetical protein